ncbi:uncharacterized protein LOC120283423 [Dioscorea cayenensis subsp. rotundata]|uniref:Uncharacterized protein LOC120283423 n=1 Tax=Dioscorea cayennensis subsp. rotundata TaxID=55577 RepID=A0AB40D6X3_DIOCR|nr:uncharacterized protein LOC120283423 [Dioscorea cayenensis subsp. rotundata]
MNEGETVDELHRDKGINPLLTHLVWQQLEDNNQIFFKEYYLRLILMEQCMEFNKLTAAVIEAKAQNASNVAQQTPALVTPGNALCNGGTWGSLMENGNGFNGIPSSQNGNMQVCQGMNGMDQISFSAGAPPLGFPAHEYGFINQAPPNYSKFNVRPQGISVAPYSTSNNLGLMEQQQFNMPTTVDGFLGQPHSFDQFFSWQAVNGVPGNEAKASNHASGVQNFSNNGVDIPSSSQYFMQ